MSFSPPPPLSGDGLSPQRLKRGEFVHQRSPTYSVASSEKLDSFSRSASRDDLANTQRSARSSDSENVSPRSVNPSFAAAGAAGARRKASELRMAVDQLSPRSPVRSQTGSVRRGYPSTFSSSPKLPREDSVIRREDSEEDEEDEEEDEELARLPHGTEGGDDDDDDDEEEEEDFLAVTQHTRVKKMTETFRPPEAGLWKERPKQAPPNLPKSHGEWVPFQSFAHVPPLSHYVLRGSVYWVAVDGTGKDESPSASPTASPSGSPVSPLTFGSSLRLKTVKSFSELYSNITPEKLLTESRCLPMVPQATAGESPVGYSYYYVRENLPVDAQDVDVFRSGYGLWLRCKKEDAEKNGEQWFEGRTKRTVDMLNLPCSTRALPKKMPTIADFVWVPYKPGLVDPPFPRDDILTAGVFRGDNGIVWQSYHHKTVPPGEFAYGDVDRSSPEQPDRGSGSDDEEAALEATLRRMEKSLRIASSPTSALMRRAPTWASPAEMPRLPRSLPKVNATSLKAAPLSATFSAKRFFWYPYLIKAHIPLEAAAMVCGRQSAGLTVYWAALGEGTAKMLKFGTSLPAETRSWASLYNVKAPPQEILAHSPPAADMSWVYYRSVADIPEEAAQFSLATPAQVATLPSGDDWLLCTKDTALMLGEDSFAPGAPPNAERAGPLKMQALVDLMPSLSPVSSPRASPKAAPAQVGQAKAVPPRPGVSVDISGCHAEVHYLERVANNTHRISEGSVWVPYHASERIVERYTSYPQLGGHMFKRGVVVWVVYSIANAPEGRRLFKGRNKPYAELLGIANVTYLPHCNPGLLSEDSAWVPFPDEAAIPPAAEVTILRSFDYVDKKNPDLNEGRPICWRLLKKSFGEGFTPSRVSFMESLGVTRAPYGLPRATKGDYWVPYPSVEQITEGYGDCPRVILQGVHYVLVEEVPAPELGFPAQKLPDIPKNLKAKWVYDTEVDSIVRRHLDHRLLMKAAARAKKQSLPKNYLLKLMYHVLSVRDEAKERAIDRIIDDTTPSRSGAGAVRETWVTQVIKVAGLARPEDVMKEEAARSLEKFMSKNKEEAESEGKHEADLGRIQADYLRLQELLARKFATQIPGGCGTGTSAQAKADRTLPPPCDVATRKQFRTLLGTVLALKDRQERRVHLLYLIIEAVFMTYYFRVNNSQILALLCMTDLDCFGEGGGIGEMKTGEGKSVTIAMTAAYYALNQQKVDIMTSSEILARRDAGKTRTYFTLLSLTVSHNCTTKGDGEEEEEDSEMLLDSPRKKKRVASSPEEKTAAYQADVVYGTVPEFQFTFIRDVYLNHNERGGRPYEIAIVDEVDNMLIDSSGRCSRLSSSIPGMDQLHWIYYLIHQKLAEWGNPDVDAIYTQLQSHPLITSLNPPPLRDTVEMNLKLWIQSCSRTRSFQANREYIVKKKQVINVDNENTGTLQYGTVLSNGVHQFLQVKENVPVSDETATGGFSSVLAFFQLYRKKTGLTGTIGDVEEKREFYACYALTFFYILPHNEPRRVDQGDVVRTKQGMVDLVQAAVKEQAGQRKRPVLIITESIGECNELTQLLTKDFPCESSPGDGNPLPHVQRYTGVQSKKEENILKDAGHPGVITVSTNLAGRGMDIVTTAQSEDHGGLYVVCCFLPINMRVELQAAGRTARQGKKGTFHLVTVSNGRSVQLLRERRTQQNQMKTAHKMEVSIPVNQHTASLFSDFCKTKDAHIEKVKHSLPFLAKYEKRALKGRWIHFMQEYHMGFQKVRTAVDAKLFIDVQQVKYDDFAASFAKDLKNRAAVTSPVQLARRATDYIKEERYVLARQDLLRALRLDGGDEHATVHMLMGFVASKVGVNGTVADVREVEKHLTRACDLHQKWFDFVVHVKRVLPRATRMTVVESVLREHLAALLTTLRDVQNWKQVKEGVPLSSLLDFVPNKSRTHSEEKVPDTCGNNTIRLKRVGLVGTVVCRFHAAKQSAIRQSQFQHAGVEAPMKA